MKASRPIYYRLADYPSREECERLNVKRPRLLAWAPPATEGESLMARRTVAFRPPRKGEWYLSGAAPAAYKAPNDLSTSYRIMKLVVIERKTRTEIRELR